MCHPAVWRPLAILLICMAMMFCFSPSSFADHRTKDVQELKFDRGAANVRTGYFIVAAVMLFAVAVVAAPITGGTSVVAVAALTGSMGASAMAATNYMDVQRYDRRIRRWSSY